MVNLLTPQAQRALATRYWLSVLTSATLLVGVAFWVGAILFLPTYFTVHAEADEAARYVQVLTDIADQRSAGAAPEALAAFSESIKLLASADQKTFVGPALAAVTGPLPNVVSLDVVRLTKSEDGVVQVVLSGIAGSRTALINYADALKQVAALRAVLLPVSALVAETNNAFSITATYTP